MIKAIMCYWCAPTDPVVKTGPWHAGAVENCLQRWRPSELRRVGHTEEHRTKTATSG